MAKSAIPMKGPVDDGQVKGNGARGDGYAMPFQAYDTGKIKGMDSLESENLDRPGFETSGYITKKGTPYGEAAKLNFLPPGMDITNQEITDQRNLKLKEITARGYPGDGWNNGSTRDIPE